MQKLYSSLEGVGEDYMIKSSVIQWSIPIFFLVVRQHISSISKLL